MYDEQKLDVIEIALLGNKCISSSQMPILREETVFWLYMMLIYRSFASDSLAPAEVTMTELRE